MLDKSKFRSLDSAPRDGTIIGAVYHEFGEANKPLAVAYAQWGCNGQGEVWTWRAPYRMGTQQYVAGWLPVDEFVKLLYNPSEHDNPVTEKPAKKKPAPTPAIEYDL